MSIERRQRKKGTVYIVWWREGGRNRNRTFDRRKDAEAFEAKVKLAKRRGDLDQLDAGKQTLEGFVEDWWRVYAEPRLERRTLDLYSGYLRLHIVPRLGSLELRQLRPEVVERYRADLGRDGVGSPTVRKVLVLLQGILERAVEWGRIQTNPARVVKKPPTTRATELTVIPPRTVELMRASLLRRGRLRDATLISVLAYAGLRPGEALALTWGDVRERTLLVNKRVTLGEVKQGAKSRARASRAVKLLKPLAQDLAEWRMASGRPDDRAPVFPRADGQVWQDHDFRNWRKRIFAPIAREAGVEKPHPYSLRASFCSLLLADPSRGSPISVAAQAGHSPRVLFDRYTTVIAELEGQESRDAEAVIREARERAVTFPSHAAVSAGGDEN